jgi:TrmH family RNA methyltransferase
MFAGVKEISSAQNPLIKLAVSLHEARDRRKQGLFLVEGLRELRLAARAGYRFRQLLFSPELIEAEALQAQLLPGPGVDCEWISLTAPLFNGLAYRKGIANALAICELRPLTLEALPLAADPLYLVVETVEKPGNLGAMLRTADALGASGVIACDPQTDFYNPNVIRASLGAFFTLPLAAAESGACIAWLRARGAAIAVSWLEGGLPPWDCDFRQPLALVMGAEATGVSPAWLEAASLRVHIPMRGQVDSMNVSVSAGMLLYEASRQRAQP